VSRHGCEAQGKGLACCENERTSERPRRRSYREQRVAGGRAGGRGGGRDSGGVGGGRGGGARPVEVDDPACVVDRRASGGRGGGRAGQLERGQGGGRGGGDWVAGARGEELRCGGAGDAAAGADFIGGGEVDGLDSEAEHGCWICWPFPSLYLKKSWMEIATFDRGFFHVWRIIQFFHFGPINFFS
jgi:hypothetical protein